MAAGGVLICALFAVGVGICLFWKPVVFMQILSFFIQKPAMLLCLVFVSALAYLYIVAGPLGIRDFLHKQKMGRGKY